VKTSGVLLLSLRRGLNAIIVIMILFSQHFQRNSILLLLLLLSLLFAFFLTSFALRWMDLAPDV
jgi:hypothetical protein